MHKILTLLCFAVVKYILILPIYFKIAMELSRVTEKYA